LPGPLEDAAAALHPGKNHGIRIAGVIPDAGVGSLSVSLKQTNTKTNTFHPNTCVSLVLVGTNTPQKTNTFNDHVLVMTNPRGPRVVSVFFKLTDRGPDDPICSSWWTIIHPNLNVRGAPFFTPFFFLS
jgi:hypothetical protein